MAKTGDLEKILGSVHPGEIDRYLDENKSELRPEEKAFSTYMRGLLKEKNISQQQLFLRADIPERYGYKLLSEEKRTKQRDVILRLCYAGEFSLEETQRALRFYEMPQLYAKIPRDAILMVAFNKRPGSILCVNKLLRQHNEQPLRTSGVQE